MLNQKPQAPAASLKIEKRVLPPNSSADFSRIEADPGASIFDRGQWPAHWIHHPEPSAGPHLLLFRKTIDVAQPLRFRAHVTADERYTLWVNGRRIAEGPERGDPDDWYFDTYDIELEPGHHTLLVRVHALGNAAPRAQMSLRPGFLFAPEDRLACDVLGTGRSEWDVARLPGYTFEPPFDKEPFSIGFNAVHDGRRIDRELERGHGAHGSRAEVGLPGANPAQRNRYPATHLLKPGLLPARRRSPLLSGGIRVVETMPTGEAPAPYPCPQNCVDQAENWNRLYQQAIPLQLPAQTRLRVLVDLEDYIGADYAIAFRGAPGASIQVGFAESLFDDTSYVNKGQREQIEGKYFKGIGDTFIASGSEATQRFESIFWRSGRFIELSIDTGASPLEIESLELYRVGFPIEWDYAFAADDNSLQCIPPLVERTLAASTDDSFMDGPYYEQMLWVGDLMQTQLTHFVTHLELPLARKAIRSFEASRLQDGLTCARWPARDRMIIAPFSLYWIEVIHDYALWRGELESLRQHMRGVRGVIDAFLEMRNADGLLEIDKGWNMVDWVPDWPMGVPPGADGGVSSILNWQFVRILGKYAHLETIYEEPELAERAERMAAELAIILSTELWDADRGLFLDAPGAATYSEHAQALAILSDRLPPEQLEQVADFTDQPITRATIAFSHFVFEALFKIGRPMPFFERLSDWKQLPEKGFLTLPEGPEPSRSDCHAWGSHPLFHLMASVLGIRPANAAFAEVRICPQLGPLQQASGRIPHPLGTVAVEFENAGEHTRADITLPAGLSGELTINNTNYALRPGRQKFE